MNIRELRDVVRFVEFSHDVSDAKNVLVDVFLEMHDDEWIVSLATHSDPHDDEGFITDVVLAS